MLTNLQLKTAHGAKPLTYDALALLGICRISVGGRFPPRTYFVPHYFQRICPELLHGFVECLESDIQEDRETEDDLLGEFWCYLSILLSS